MSDAVPRGDAAFLTWITQFQSAAAAQAAALGLSAAEVATLLADRDGFAARLAAHQGARDAADAALAAKRTERRRVEKAFRAVARKVSANGIDAALRASLGLPKRDTVRTRAGRPEGRPLLTIDTSHSGRHMIRFVDEATPTRRGKPRGVAGIALHMKKGMAGGGAGGAAGGGEPKDDGELLLLAYATRSPYVVRFTLEESGATVWYRARWLNARQEPGPWSAIVSARVG